MTPALKLPKALRRPPLVEAIVEVRFTSRQEAAGALLPGLLFSKLESQYPKAEALPVANIPRDIRLADDNLRYQPTHRLIGSARQVHLGDRVFSISKTPPYDGWSSFCRDACEALRALRELSIVQAVERYSIKCINILEPGPNGQLGLLNAQIELAGQPPPESGFHLRTEFATPPFVSIVQIITNAETTQGPESTRSGLLVDVDTIRMSAANDLLETPTERLEEAHRVVKEQFFSLLRAETIDDLDPEWESR